MNYQHALDEWELWTGILNEEQARQLVETWIKRSEQPQPRKREETMAKSLYVLTFPATVTVLVESGSDKEAIAAGKAAAEAGLSTPGLLRVVGDAKVTSVAGAKADAKADKSEKPSKSKKEKDEDDEDEDAGEEEDEDEEEDEGESDDEDDDEDDEESDDEDEDEKDDEDEDEDEEPSSKKKGKKDSDGDKKKPKVKIKLNKKK